MPERLTGGWLIGGPDRRLVIEDPLTDDERREVARACEKELALGFPMIVDSVDDTVNRAYAAWPDRLYLVDLDGSVIFKGEKGPTGFLPDELGRVIDEVLAFYGSPTGSER